MVELRKNLTQHKNVIWALLNREIITKFDDSYFSYAWVLLEPLLLVLMFFLMFYFLGRNAGNMPILLFLITGIVPFLFLRKAITSSAKSISANKALLAYKQVKVIDTVIARITLEMIITISILIICYVILLYFEESFTLYYPLRIFYSLFSLICLALGLGILLSILCYYFIDLNKFLNILLRGLFFTSGVFFSLEEVPSTVAYYLSYNPIFQCIEIMRSAFNKNLLPNFISYEYTSIFTLICLFVGILFYYVSRDNILKNDRAR